MVPREGGGRRAEEPEQASEGNGDDGDLALAVGFRGSSSRRSRFLDTAVSDRLQGRAQEAARHGCHRDAAEDFLQASVRRTGQWAQDGADGRAAIDVAGDARLVADAGGVAHLQAVEGTSGLAVRSK